MDKIIEFEKDLSSYWHCEGRDHHTIGDLRQTLANEKHPISAVEFQKILGDVISLKHYSVDKYEVLTGINFEDVDGVAEDLRQLQRELFG